MKQYHLEESPIVYYISRKERAEWILFIHAAFVNHNMFQAQIDYFQDKYNILTLDIIGHGKSTKVQKGDSIDKMSSWINKILKTEKIEIVPINFEGIEDLPLLPTEIAGTLCVCPNELYEGFFIAKIRKTF